MTSNTSATVGADGVTIKRVAYAYNSSLEAAGVPAYFLDVMVIEDGRTVVDLHEKYQTRDEILDAMEDVVPALVPGVVGDDQED